MDFSIIYVIHVKLCKLALQYVDGNILYMVSLLQVKLQRDDRLYDSFRAVLVPSDLFMADGCFHCL